MYELILIVLAAVASIGPTNLFAIKEGIKNGFFTAFSIIFGGVLVDLFYANLALLGVKKIGENIYFKTSLLLMGSIFFTYLGAKGLKIAFQKEMIEAAKIEKKAPPLILGILMTLPNPFVIIFWTTALANIKIHYNTAVLCLIILAIGGL